MKNKIKDENDELDSLVYLVVAITIACIIISAISAIIMHSIFYSSDTAVVTASVNLFYLSIASTLTQ